MTFRRSPSLSKLLAFVESEWTRANAPVTLPADLLKEISFRASPFGSASQDGFIWGEWSSLLLITGLRFGEASTYYLLTVLVLSYGDQTLEVDRAERQRDNTR